MGQARARGQALASLPPWTRRSRTSPGTTSGRGAPRGRSTLGSFRTKRQAWWCQRAISGSQQVLGEQALSEQVLGEQLGRASKPSARAAGSERRHADMAKPSPASDLLIPEAGKQASQHQSHYQKPKHRHRKPVAVRCGAKIPSVGDIHGRPGNALRDAREAADLMQITLMTFGCAQTIHNTWP
jgi:hypothetical protein